MSSNVWRYFQNQFRNDLRTFFASKNQIAGSTPEVVRDRTESFHSSELIPGSDDHLAHIPEENLPLFAVSLTYVVLINEMVHSHFRDIYEKFKEACHYPFLAGGLNPGAPAFNILDADAWEQRGVSKDKLIESWREIISHLKNDIIAFETQKPEIELPWAEFSDKLASDKDVQNSEWGQELLKLVQKT